MSRYVACLRSDRWWALTDSNQYPPPAPYFLKVYGLSRPEVHGHALKWARLDIQSRRTRNPTRAHSNH